MAVHHCRISDAVAEALCNLVAAAVDAGPDFGRIVIYTGAEPATANETAATEVAVCTGPDPSFGAAVWNAETACWEATNLGDFVCGGAIGSASTVTHFRLADSIGGAVLQGTCSADAGDDLVLTGAVIVPSAEVVVTDFVISVPINQA